MVIYVFLCIYLPGLLMIQDYVKTQQPWTGLLTGGNRWTSKTSQPKLGKECFCPRKLCLIWLLWCWDSEVIVRHCLRCFLDVTSKHRVPIKMAWSTYLVDKGHRMVKTIIPLNCSMVSIQTCVDMLMHVLVLIYLLIIHVEIRTQCCLLNK